FGRVTYVHGVGIDAPLAVTREGLAGTSGGLSVYPHGNWRGEYTDGSVPGQTVPHSNCLGHADCKPISWPGRHLTLNGAPVPGTPAPVSWWGSLLARKTDGSGLQYMRNRYYDPQTGRFTQLDPIGLAGGVNQYGFAAGDPLNYTDPFGLCPGIPNTTQLDLTVCPRGYFQVVFAALGGGGGAVIGGFTGGTGG